MMTAKTRSATSNRRPTTRRLAGVIVAGAALSTMLFGGVGVAVAQDCPVTDPTCVLDTVDDTVGDVQTVVDDTTNTAKDDVAATTDRVIKTVDGLTGGDGAQPPGEGNGDGSSGHDGGGTKHDGGGGGSAGGSVQRSVPPSGPSVLAREGGTRTLLGTATVERNGEPTDPSQSRGVATRLREAATRIALSLVAVLVAVLLFTAVQVRLDRREPKLALAPVTSDVLAFE
jgi:hypothetical protein